MAKTLLFVMQSRAARDVKMENINNGDGLAALELPVDPYFLFLQFLTLSTS